MASTMLDFPEPLGPTTTVMPGGNSNRVRSAKLLKPRISRALSIIRMDRQVCGVIRGGDGRPAFPEKRAASRGVVLPGIRGWPQCFTWEAFIDVQESNAILRWRFSGKNRPSVGRPHCMTNLRVNSKVMQRRLPVYATNPGSRWLPLMRGVILQADTNQSSGDIAQEVIRILIGSSALIS